MSEIILEKDYHGFESWSDIERDVGEAITDSDIPAEGAGTITVKMVYTKRDREEDYGS